MKKCLPILVVVALAAATASAGISTEFVEVTSGTTAIPTGYRVWDMMVTTDTDWTNELMDLTLTSGSMFQDLAWGGNVEPNPGLHTVFPPVEWDTYAADPMGYPTLASFAATPTIDATDFDASWFNSANDGAGTFKIARITLSDTANGTVVGTSYDRDSTGVGVDFSYNIENGVIVPEPTTMLLLGIGGIGALIRKRR